VLAIASLVSVGGDDAVDVTTATAATGSEAGVVRAASVGSPSEVRELLSETTTTLVEATGATTSTTAAPATSTSTTAAGPATEDGAGIDGTSTTTEAPTARALHTETTESTTTSAAPTTTATPRRQATTTTAAPRPAPTTTAAPTTTTTEPPPPPPTSEPSDGGYAYDDPRGTQVWYDLAQCESGGNWSINTGNGYYGGLQFALATWESVGGSGYPHEHPAATQIDFGRTLQARQGWGAWPHCSEKLGLR